MSIKEMDNESLSLMTQKGFIVDDKVDEAEIIHQEFENYHSDDTTFKLTVNPTLNCNFRCWYCYETHKATSNMSKETVEKVKRCIDLLSCKYKSMELSFFGGEPMLKYKEMVRPLIRHLHKTFTDKGLEYSITFTTNGYLITDEIIAELRQYNMGISQITLDGGPATHNKTRCSAKQDSFRTIVGNIRKMVAARLPVLIRINVTQQNICEAKEIIDYFKEFTDVEKSLLNVLIQQVWQDVDKDIVDEIWELYSHFVEVGIKPWPRRFNFYRSACYADNRHTAVINYNGKIYKCTAIDFDKKDPDGEVDEYGHINIDSAFDRRLNKRKNNRLCANCRILPLCNGGCSKNVDQSVNRDYCLYPTEEDKNKLVQRIIREQLHISRLGLSWTN